MMFDIYYFWLSNYELCSLKSNVYTYCQVSLPQSGISLRIIAFMLPIGLVIQTSRRGDVWYDYSETGRL